MPRKAELVKAIADESGISKKDATAALDAFVSYLSDSMKGSDTVTIPGLGKVTVKSRKDRAGRNPYSGGMRVPAKEVLRFRSGKAAAKDALGIFTGTYKKL